ncbi:MAG TPA: LamG domain-containing protein, partial [Blastocatellia bacterium]|nr:LamG domain-containing protein [Blastocatellia bacterium]
MPDDGLILHWDMLEIKNGRLEDASEKDNDGLVEGDPQLVPDDVFGSCLSFNEAGEIGDHVVAKNIGLAGANPAHTIEAWVYLKAFPSKRSRLLVLGQYASGAHRWSLDSKGIAQLGEWNSAQFNPKIPNEAWTHIAVVYDGKQLSCYVNGVIHKKPTTTKITLVNWDLAVAQGAPGELDFSGKIASIRVYNRALSAAEINLDMQDDQTAMASFRQTHPVDFNLYDDDDQQALYIDDDPAGRNLRLELTNTSRQAIEFIKQSGDVAAGNHHLEMRFRPGTLSAASLKSITVAESEWRLAPPLQNGGGVSLYLLNTQGRTILPTDKIKLTLQHVSADGGDGARGTRVELKYRQLKYPNDLAPIEGFRTRHLSVVNQIGKKNIPLHVGFVGPNIVLNDGKSSTDLILRLTNVLSDDSIPWTPGTPTGAKTSKLLVMFDMQKDGENKDWALGTKDDLTDIDIDCEGWAKVENKQGISPGWTLTTDKLDKLAPGQSIFLKLTGVKSSLPSGHANLYIRYENIPGYWDGQFICVAEKAPLVYRQNFVGISTTKPQDFVGIGTTKPRNPLSIRGAGVSEDLLAFEDVGGTTKWHINQKLDGTKPGLNFAETGVPETGVSESRLFIKAGGEIGVGTTNPTAGTKLTVSASTNHLQLRREATASAGKALFLELFQDEPQPTGGIQRARDIYPSIRFKHNTRFSHRIEGRIDGIHFKEGNLEGDGYIDVFADNLMLNRMVRFGDKLSGNYIQKGSDFVVPNNTQYKTNQQGYFFANLRNIDGIKIVGKVGGVLATANREVLLWNDINGIGEVIVKGKIWAQEKNFLIPHPIKPGYNLVHSCIEGPEVGVYYRGEAQLRKGETLIRLPEYFEALTRKEGRTVQLTAKGKEPFRLSYEEIKDGQFKVYGTKSNGEFSWEVKAVRAD